MMRVCLSSREVIWGGGEVFLHSLGTELQSRGIEVCWRVEAQSELADRIQEGQIVDRRRRASYDLLVANDFRSLWQAVALDGRRQFTFVGHGPWQFSPLRNRILKLVRARTLVVSESVAEYARDTGLSGTIGVLPLGPGLWSSPPSSPHHFGSKEITQLVFGSVARLDPIKRLPLFARVTRELGVQAILVVPTPTSEDEAAMLDQIANHENVELRTGGNVGKLWEDIDVFLSTSESESLGLAHLEALQNGVPVVSTAANGPGDFLTRELKLGWMPNIDADLLSTEIASRIEAMQECATEYWIHAETVLSARSVSRCADMILERQT